MSTTTVLCVVVLCGIVLFGSRRHALIALFAAIVFLSFKTSIDVFGLRMWPLRLLELAAFVRVVARGEFAGHSFGRVDRAVVVAYGYATVAFMARSALGLGTSSDITMVTTLSKLGEFVDVLLLYIAFRGLTHDLSDFRWLLTKLLYLLAPFVGFVIIERITWSNPLALLGGIPSIWLDANDGRIRCFGSFLHPVLLGTFGAVVALSYASLAMAKHHRRTGVLGIALGLVIVLLANSGGPLAMLAAGLVAWACWLFRGSLKAIRFAMVAMLILIAIVMKDPIWYLPSKMSLLFGGGGWHRSYLMNQAITHLEEWWFIGMPLDMTQEWLPYLVMGSADVTNLYLSFGLDGGLIAVLLLIRLFAVAFSELGKTLATTRATASPNDTSEELLLWALGACLVGHAANFLAVTYFDQTTAVWLFQLATIASASAARTHLVDKSSVPDIITARSRVSMRAFRPRNSRTTNEPRTN